MSADPINANPTILDAADLPRRQSHRSSNAFNPTGYEASSIFAAFQPSPDYALDPISSSPSSCIDQDEHEPIDAQEIFDLISTISDPEHPLSLGSLAVVSLPDISIVAAPAPSALSTVTVLITPTITHCSLATVIGLGVRVRLEQALPPRFRLDVRIKPGSHSTADQVTKQLNDKERVAAALENGTLMGVLHKMLEPCT